MLDDTESPYGLINELQANYSSLKAKFDKLANWTNYHLANCPYCRRRMVGTNDEFHGVYSHTTDCPFYVERKG